MDSVTDGTINRLLNNSSVLPCRWYSYLVACMYIGSKILISAIPRLITIFGFTKKGIRKNSLATSLMSASAFLNGGGVRNWNLVSTGQKVATSGLGFFGRVVATCFGGMGGWYIGKWLAEFAGDVYTAFYA